MLCSAHSAVPQRRSTVSPLARLCGSSSARSPGPRGLCPPARQPPRQPKHGEKAVSPSSRNATAQLRCDITVPTGFSEGSQKHCKWNRRAEMFCVLNNDCRTGTALMEGKDVSVTERSRFQFRQNAVASIFIGMDARTNGCKLVAQAHVGFLGGDFCQSLVTRSESKILVQHEELLYD